MTQISSVEVECLQFSTETVQRQFGVADRGEKPVPLTAKLLCPNILVLVRGPNNVTIMNCRTKMMTTRIVSHRHDHLSQTFWCSPMHAPVDDTDFEILSLFNRDPMEVVSKC